MSTSTHVNQSNFLCQKYYITISCCLGVALGIVSLMLVAPMMAFEWGDHLAPNTKLKLYILLFFLIPFAILSSCLGCIAAFREHLACMRIFLFLTILEQIILAVNLLVISSGLNAWYSFFFNFIMIAVICKYLENLEIIKQQKEDSPQVFNL